MDYQYLVSEIDEARAQISREPIPDRFVKIQWADRALCILAAKHGKMGYLNEIMGVYRIYDSGLWSGLSETQQIEGGIEFYEQMNANLKFQYDNTIRTLIVQGCV